MIKNDSQLDLRTLMQTSILQANTPKSRWLLSQGEDRKDFTLIWSRSGVKKTCL